MRTRASRDVLGRGLRVLGQAIRTEPRLFVVGTVGSSLFGLLVIANSYVVGAVIGHVVVPAFTTGRAGTGELALIAAAFLGISVLRVASIFGRRLGAGFMQFRLQARYRRAVTRRYLSLPPSWHQRHATGTLLSNANSDVEAAFVPIAPLPFAVGTIVMLVAAVLALFLTDWVLALVGVTLFPMLFGLNVVYSRHMSPRQIHAQQMRAKVSAVAHESFDGALVVKTMGREADESRRFAVFVAELRDALISVGRLRGLFDPVMDALPSVGTLAVLLLGAWRLRAGAVSVAELVTVAFLFTVLAFPVRAIGWVVAELPRSVAGWDRVQAVLAAGGDLAYGSRRAPGEGPAELRFEHVDFRYADGPLVLNDVSFTVPPGRTVAVVGATGSGKSTIAALAVRLVDPADGRITVAGVPLPELSEQALAATSALVPQIPFVFDDTVRGNVTLDRDGLDDRAAWAALRLAQAEEFVARLPDGLDTAVGERGTSLSGGQRQRLTLARALAGGPRLLVLDDATSAVDPRVEAAILAALRGRDRSAGAAGPQQPGIAATSILVVAYRRATIALADEVVYLEQGKVVATGTHSELLAEVPGYADLVTAYEKAEREQR